MKYEHKTQYYETDQMGIIHHSNYIRWFEEARVDFMEGCGFSYAQMEKDGLISPVLSVSYTVRDKETGEVRCLGKSSHCFLDREGRPVSLKRGWDKYHQGFSKESVK